MSQKVHTVNYAKKGVFVFGSNQAGIHGKGAALHAKLNYGAQQGIGEGYVGNSYALPTKDYKIQSLTLTQIYHHIEVFLDFAYSRSDLKFNVTQVGCGLAGYKADRIAPAFHRAPKNCYFDPEWTIYFGQFGRFWFPPI